MNRRLSWISSGITGNRWTLFSAILPGLILISVFAKIGIFPFGDGTLLLSDMSTQYVDFMAEYQRILHGNGSLFYSWHAGIGLNFLGLFAYYLSSPFNLLLFFFPEKNLLDAITLITVLKISGCGLTFAIYLRGRFADRQSSGVMLVAFSAAYALMGYSVAYAFNIIWLDGVLLLPLLCLSLDRLIQGRGWLGCVLVYALLFLSNFYIASMVGVFSVLYFLAGLVNAEPRMGWTLLLKRCALFAAAVLLAAGVSAFLLLPAYYVLNDNMGLIGQSFPAFAMQFAPADLFGKLLIGTYDGLKGNLPHIYSGLLCLCLLPLYFFAPGVRNGRKLSTALLMILLLVSFNLAPLDFFWHAFDYPSWFPYRYSFLFSFLILTAAFEGSLHLGTIPRKYLFHFLSLDRTGWWRVDPGSENGSGTNQRGPFLSEPELSLDLRYPAFHWLIAASCGSMVAVGAGDYGVLAEYGGRFRALPDRCAGPHRLCGVSRPLPI